MTDTTLSHAPSGHPLHDLSNRLVDRFRQRRRRRGLKRLMDLDDQMLHDIGVTRGEIDVVLAMPMSVDAGLELHRMSLERRRRHM